MENGMGDLYAAMRQNLGLGILWYIGIALILGLGLGFWVGFFIGLLF